MGATLGLFWSAWTTVHRRRPNIDASAETRNPTIERILETQSLDFRGQPPTALNFRYPVSGQ